MDLFVRQAAPPPVSLDYLNYNIAPQLLTIVGTLAGLAIFVFILRLYVRTVVLNVFGADDYLMLGAVVWRPLFPRISITK